MTIPNYTRKRWTYWYANATAVMMIAFIGAIPAVKASHGDGSGQSYTFLEPSFTQEIFGVSSHFFLGGVAFAPDGDVWVNDCSGSGSDLHRYDAQTPLPPVNGTNDLHVETIVPSNAGCGMTNHQNEFIYSNTFVGAVEIDADTGSPSGNVFGPPGNALGIAPDPQTGDVVYVAENCRFTEICDIITVDPTTGVFGTFVSLPGAIANFIDGIYFNLDGSQLFLATRSPTFAATVVDRDFPGAKTGTFNRNILLPSEPDGISFHSSGFVITTNLDGTITKIIPGPDTISTFASGGFRADLSQVGPDNCVYITQFGTRYDDGTTTSQSSLVRICPDFLPPPGVKPSLLSKAIVAGPDRDNDGEVDAIIETNQTSTTEYIWKINYHNLGIPDVLITDSAPAESVVTAINGDSNFGTLPLNCGEETNLNLGLGEVYVSRGGNEGNNCHSDTGLQWTPANDNELLLIDVQMRESPGKGHAGSTFAPTSCGPIYLNEGAKAFEVDQVTGEPLRDPYTGEVLPPLLESNSLCVAAVRSDLLPGDGFGPEDDHDGDGIASYAEACTNEIQTNPCLFDTDGDGMSDDLDECPLDGPPNIAIGEALGESGCIVIPEL